MNTHNIAALHHELKALLSRVSHYRKDAGYALYVNSEPTPEGVTDADKVVSLQASLIEAQSDFLRIYHDLNGMLEDLENLQDAIEYEALASSIR
jgi:hypothetical protein